MHVSNEPNITMAQIIAHDKHCQSTYVENNTKSLIMQYYADPGQLYVTEQSCR